MINHVVSGEEEEEGEEVVWIIWRACQRAGGRGGDAGEQKRTLGNERRGIATRAVSDEEPGGEWGGGGGV